MKSRTLLRFVACGVCFFVQVGPVRAKDLVVAASKPNLVYVVDGDTVEVRMEVALEGPGPPAMIAFHPTGDRLFVVTNRWREVAVVSVGEGKQVGTLAPGTESERVVIMALEVHPKGKELFVYEVPSRFEKDRVQVLPPRIRVVDVETLETLRTFEVPRQISLLAFNPAGDVLYALGHAIYLLAPDSGEMVRSLPLKHLPRVDIDDPDVSTLWPVHEQSGVLSTLYYARDRITDATMLGIVNLDLESGSLEWIELESARQVIFTSVVDPSRRHAYLVYNTLTKVDLAQRRIEKRVTLDHTYYVANVSSDGRKIYLGGTQPDLAVYDADTLEPLKKIRLKGDQGTASLRVMRVAGDGVAPSAQ